MRVVICLFLLAGLFVGAFGQAVVLPSDGTQLFQLSKVTYDSAQTKHVKSSSLNNRTFASDTVTGITDTSQIVALGRHKTHYVSVATRDSGVILIKYRLSLDAQNFAAIVTKDSCVQSSDVPVVKSIDMTSTVLGSGYIQYIFQSTNNQHNFGTTSPKYQVVHKFSAP